MIHQTDEYLQFKRDQDLMFQKWQQAERRQFDFSNLWEKRSDQCQQEETDLTYLKKTLEYVQRIETRQGEQDKMIKIQQNQRRMLNALVAAMRKTQKQQLKIRKNNKTFLCEDCQNPKYFANKYTLRRHKTSMHSTSKHNTQKHNTKNKDIGLFH